jgi:hypothetical protein
LPSPQRVPMPKSSANWPPPSPLLRRNIRGQKRPVKPAPKTSTALPRFDQVVVK